ncbi:MAG: glycogen debranching enzyme GlgX [Acidobacteria bacterium]|nr:MAG: glycogen debranching enzyme GlgX [Acidobacteriota bacterium]
MLKVHSPDATRVDVCVFERADAPRESSRMPMSRSDGGDWTADVSLPAGTCYAVRAEGPGLSRDRLLLDPRALAIGRLPSPLDPLGAVIDTAFDWRDDRRPSTPWRDTVIYEAHVRGLTRLHPDVPPDLGGTFLGLATPPVIEHLKRLGVTAIELLPVHAHADEPALVARGLTNYWGYNSLSFFAPDPRFAVERDPGAPVREFKTMVRSLHAAGLEVILDVVYNHTAEGPETGPTLSWRGLDPKAYRRDPHTSALVDWTGCGNTVNTDDPAMRALILDSLRYWAVEMRVDGFRFDLASALDRDAQSPASLIHQIRHDPDLAGLKLIVEPWDAAGHYRLGTYPAGIAEWNDRYRDAIRRFWRGDAGSTPAFVTAICGSDDVIDRAARSPQDSINYVTAHDGFTLADLVSYSERHNEANGEGNRDGTAENFSSNAGAEGPTDDPRRRAERGRRQRSLFATLALSLGVPMISGGDELGRTQHGNNNAYCHDSPLSWTSWPNVGGDAELLEFASRAFGVRRRHAAFRRERHLTAHDVTWLTAAGKAIADADWQRLDLRTFGMWLGSDSANSLLIYFNAAPDAVRVALPSAPHWHVALNSDAGDRALRAHVAGAIDLAPVSLIVLEREAAG